MSLVSDKQHRYILRQPFPDPRAFHTDKSQSLSRRRSKGRVSGSGAIDD